MFICISYFISVISFFISGKHSANSQSLLSQPIYLSVYSLYTPPTLYATHAASPHIIGGRGRDGAFPGAAESEEGGAGGVENIIANVPPGTEDVVRGALSAAVLEQGLPMWGAVGDLSPRALRLVPGIR